jgi:4-amino-4-deoxy-L-arabinose transferase-like glycosyltransferase
MTAVDVTPRSRDLSLRGSRALDEWPLLALFLVVQAVAWTGLPATVFTAPPSNTLELALWARDWFIVNYKHPGLAAWLLRFAYDVFGTHLWVSLLLAQLCIAATYVFVFMLGRDLMGSGEALLGTLLLPAVSYLTIGTLKYNHNIAQLPLWVGFIFVLWRASRSDRLPWWILTAAFAALGLYAKFTMAMVIGMGAVWILLDGEARSRLKNRTPYIALLMFVVLLLPLAIALGATGFGSIAWVSQESAKRGISGLHFLRDVGETVSVMAGGLIVSLGWNRLRPRQTTEPTPSGDRRAFVFLLLMGGGPLLLTLMIALVKPVRLEWAAPMFSMIGLLLVGLAVRFRPLQESRVKAGLSHALLALTASLCVLGIHLESAVQHRATGRIGRTLWPASEIATRFDGLWQKWTGGPLQIVAGNSWTAGIVGLMSAGHPSLFTDLDLQRSPAITQSRLQDQGMLIVWTEGPSWHPDQALIARFPHGSESFFVGPRARQLTLDYLLVPPGQWTAADSEQWLEPDDD